MKGYRRSTPLTAKGTYLRKRIAKTRAKAKFIGYCYLLAIFALAAAACFPLLVHDYAPVGVLEFWKQFKPSVLKAFDYKNTPALITLAVCSLYALMLLGVALNVFRALRKLRWLHKKKPSKMYGFNRNVYAMEDLGRIFSGSFAVLLTSYFLMAILCGSANVNKLMLIVLGGGLFLHLLLGLWGSGVAYYDIAKDEIVEQTRQVGRFAPLVRNVFQLAAVFGILYFFLELTDLNAYVAPLSYKEGWKALINNKEAFVFFASQVFIVLCLFVLIKHATAITEFNMEGSEGSGMKIFRVFAFFIFLAAGAKVAYQYVFIDGKVLDKQMLSVAAIAFGIFLIELIMHAMPRPLNGAALKETKKQADEELTLDNILRSQHNAN